MANAIRPEDLAHEVRKELESYVGATEDMIVETTLSIARQTTAKLKATSPRGRRRNHPYAKSWTYSTKPGATASEFAKVIHVRAPEYRLTHLLEYGHALVRGGREVGSADPRPHIQEAERQAVSQFVDTLREKIRNGNL